VDKQSTLPSSPSVLAPPHGSIRRQHMTADDPVHPPSTHVRGTDTHARTHTLALWAAATLSAGSSCSAASLSRCPSCSSAAIISCTACMPACRPSAMLDGARASAAQSAGKQRHDRHRRQITIRSADRCGRAAQQQQMQGGATSSGTVPTPTHELTRMAHTHARTHARTHPLTNTHSPTHPHP
jgi:hypothetical protein